MPGTTIDRQCGSSQQAAHFAAQGVIAGVYDVAVAAGVESMTRVPMGITMQQGPGQPFGPRMVERYDDGLVPQGMLVGHNRVGQRRDVDEFLGRCVLQSRLTEQLLEGQR